MVISPLKTDNKKPAVSGRVSSLELLVASSTGNAKLPDYSSGFCFLSFLKNEVLTGMLINLCFRRSFIKIT
jgi:hypothetical protein